MPVVRVRGFSTKLPPDEAQMGVQRPANALGTYITHRQVSYHSSTGDSEWVLDSIGSFLEGHRFLDVAANPRRVGALGELVVARMATQEQHIPSPSLAIFMGQLPDLAGQVQTPKA